MLTIRIPALFKSATPIEKILGYTFHNRQLLNQALTHRSAALNGESYERLEFLGDAVLSLLIAELLFTKYPSKKEGELTALRAELVRGSTLAQVGKKIALEKFIVIDKSVNLKDRATLHRILASSVESLLGAVYLDGGIKVTRRLVQKLFNEILVAKREVVDTNFKGRLFEYCQKNSQPLPVFKVLKASGPEHAKLYHVAVYINGKNLGIGKAPQKRAAEQQAAQQALKRLSPNYSAPHSNHHR